jgi:hypothetical protein
LIRWAFLALTFLPPCLAAAPVQPLPEWRYTVRPGDTLIGIARMYLHQPRDWPQIQRLNRVLNPFILLPGSSLRIPIGLLKQQPAPARVISVSGQVSATLPGAPSSGPLAAGTALPVGASLQTRSGSAVIEFADGSRLVMQPNSSLSLDSLSVYAGGGMVDTRVRLQQGRAELSANPRKQPGHRFEVITPSAVAAVRGTTLRVFADASLMREETLDGHVSVAALGVEVTVGQAQGTLAEAGKPPRPPVALLGAPDVSALPARLDRYPLRFPLPGLKGAESWSGQIAPDSTFNDILLEKEARGPLLAFSELPDGKYFLRLRGVDALGLHGLDSLHAFEVDAHPFPPILGKPVNDGTLRVPQPALDWTLAQEARRYRVQVSRDTAFSQMHSDEVVETASYQTAALQAGGYAWRVASIDAAGEQGPFSDAHRFVYKPAPGAPDLGGSSIQISDDALRIELPALPAGQQYEALLARDADLKEVLWRGKPEGVRLSLPRPDAGTYYLGARGVEADGTAGPYSSQAVAIPSRPWWPYLFLLTPLLLL